MSISATRSAGLAMLSCVISTEKPMRKHGLLALAVAAAFAAPLAEARVTSIKILERATAFGGHDFPGVGQYEKITGIAYGEVNPHDRQNRVIVDIEFAPLNSRGNVEYAFNFYILKPVDLSKGARRVMYEPPNRGGKTWNSLGRVSSGPGGANDPASIVDPVVLANSFLMPRGYTMVWSGWEHDLGPLEGLTASAVFPIAKNRDGSSITGPSYEYIVTGGASSGLAYPAASLDTSKAKLTHRVHLDDVPQPFPHSVPRRVPRCAGATSTRARSAW